MLVFQILADAPAKRTGISEKEMYLAVQRAGRRLGEYVRSYSNTVARVQLGPNLESAYWYRVQPEDYETYGAYSMNALLDRAREAKAAGLPVAQRDVALFKKNGVDFGANGIVCEHEMRAVLGISLNGRERATRANGILTVVKHFPGGDSAFETTEKDSVDYKQGLQQLRDAWMWPFEAALSRKDGKAPRAIMVGHASFSTAEKQLREKYPKIASIAGDAACPASLSPHIVRGLLRQELGFEGLIVADWYSMSSIDRFLEAAWEKLPAEYRGLDKRDLLFVFAVYAGVNWITASPVVSEEFRKFYQGNAQFREMLDAHALESLFLKLKAMPAGERKEFDADLSGIRLWDLHHPQDLPDAKRKVVEKLKAVLEGKEKGMLNPGIAWDKNIPLDIKIRALTVGEDKNNTERISPVIDMVAGYYTQWADTWNRGGLLDMELRKNIVEELSGKKFPAIREYGRDGSKWLPALFGNREFMEEYRKIEWDGPQMRRLFARYAQSVYGIGEKAENLGGITPKKISG